MDNIPWFIKHRPKRFTELVFSSDVHFKFLNWMKRKTPGNILHISGPPGSGKTLLVRITATSQGYAPLEIDSDMIPNINDYTRNPTGTIGNKPNLLIVDESVVLKNNGVIKTLKRSHTPVIITSTEMHFKDMETLKISKPTLENVLQMANKILKAEGKNLDSKAIIRIASQCDRDIRSTINNLQLIVGLNSNGTELYKNIAQGNIFTKCQNFFRKRLRMKELESFFSNKVSELCMSSALENVRDLTLLTKMLSGVSDSDIIHPDYMFLSLAAINEYSGEFTYMKSETQEVKPPIKHDSPVFFIDKCIRNTKSMRSVIHLQEIFKKYKITNLNKLDLEISNTKHFKAITKKVFGYKHFHGSSAAVQRDTTLSELLDFN